MVDGSGGIATIPTVCGGCHNTCPMFVDVKDGQVPCTLFHIACHRHEDFWVTLCPRRRYSSAFNNPPDDTYATYNEEITRRGADLRNCITEHDVTIEVYAYDFHDEEAVRRVAAVLDRHALPYRKYETTYINSEHLFQTRFELSFTSKDGPPQLDWEPEGIYDF